MEKIRSELIEQWRLENDGRVAKTFSKKAVFRKISSSSSFSYKPSWIMNYLYKKKIIIFCFWLFLKILSTILNTLFHLFLSFGQQFILLEPFRRDVIYYELNPFELFMSPKYRSFCHSLPPTRHFHSFRSLDLQ